MTDTQQKIDKLAEHVANLEAEVALLNNAVSAQPTLRDQFAMAALHGIMANPSGPIQSNGMSGWGWCNCSPDDVTDLVYSMADVMLKEGQK